MKVGETLQTVRDAVSARRVFGEPVERHGVTVIPVASVLGGGGGGDQRAEGAEAHEAGTSAGFGFGLWGRPVAAIEITERGMQWKRAPLDVTGIVMVALMFGVPAVLSAWRRRRAR